MWPLFIIGLAICFLIGLAQETMEKARRRSAHYYAPPTPPAKKPPPRRRKIMT